jgi:hypothetical protein
LRAALGGVVLLDGCAATVAPHVRDAPHLSAGAASVRIAVIQGEGPTELSAEVRALLSPLGSVAAHAPSAGESLDDVCRDAVDLVVRVSARHFAFASNAAERNTLFIYESAVIVGLPVTAISSFAWHWYGEYIMDGDLETLWCGSARVAHTLQTASLRASGSGIIAQDTLQGDLRPHAAVTLARALVESAAGCGRLEKGGERCANGTQ